MQQTSPTPQPSPRRDMAMAEASRLILALLRCVLFLIRRGVHVVGFTGLQRNGTDRVTVTVAPSPYLYHLYQGQCCWTRRRQEGHLTIFTWFAINDDGIRIEWEEVCAYPVQ